MIQIPVQAVFRHLEWDEVRVRAFTLAISAHGCLLDMDIKPEQGQRMRLLNAESAAEQSGRVIRVQRTQGGSFAVEFEFDSRLHISGPLFLPLKTGAPPNNMDTDERGV